MLSSSIALIAEELITALESLQQKDVEKAAQSILSHERVFVGAAGRSGLMLKAFAMRLMQMGKTVYAIGETVTPAVREGETKTHGRSPDWGKSILFPKKIFSKYSETEM